MLPRTHWGVPAREEKRCEDSKKRRKNLLTPAGLVRDTRLTRLYAHERRCRLSGDSAFFDTFGSSAIFLCSLRLRTAVFREHSTESIMSLKARDLLTRSWQSQANLSLFLLLLVLIVFLLPSLGFEKNSLHFYDDAATSVLAVVGTAIAWRNRKLFLLTSVAVIVAIALHHAPRRRPTPTLSVRDAANK